MMVVSQDLDLRPRRQPIGHHPQPVALPAVAQDDPAQAVGVDLFLPQLVETHQPRREHPTHRFLA